MVGFLDTLSCLHSCITSPFVTTIMTACSRFKQSYCSAANSTSIPHFSMQCLLICLMAYCCWLLPLLRWESEGKSWQHPTSPQRCCDARHRCATHHRTLSALLCLAARVSAACHYDYCSLMLWFLPVAAGNSKETLHKHKLYTTAFPTSRPVHHETTHAVHPGTLRVTDAEC